MNIKSVINLVAILMLVIVGLSIFNNHSRRTPPTETAPSPEAWLSKPAVHPRLPAPRIRPSTETNGEPVEDKRATNLIATLLKDGNPPPLTPAQIEAYLQANRRGGESLIAAFRATGDRALLREAVEKYPNDPRVNYAAYFAALHDPQSTPEERRQRAEALKLSAPDNALPNYLAAQQYFKSGQADDAVRELIAASGKTRFQDYSQQFILDAEELYRASGYSEAESKLLGGYSLPLPQLAELKRLSQSLGDLSAQYRQAGDEASAQAAMQMGLNMSHQFTEQSGQDFLINNLVGLSMERQLLERMDPASPYDNSGHTVKDRIDELAKSRDAIKQLAEQNKAMLPTLSEAELVKFYERVQVSGEMNAIRWIASRRDNP